jgi:ABC-type glutathione transport system ATPase component
VFVIAHRLSTVQRADQIVVLERGRIVEHGDHSSLLERDGLYRKLYALQFRDDEVPPTSTSADPADPPPTPPAGPADPLEAVGPPA